MTKRETGFNWSPSFPEDPRRAGQSPQSFMHRGVDMEIRKRTIPLDQIVFAIPAALFIFTPLLDLFIDYFQTITHTNRWGSFAVIPYLPRVIAAILAVALIVRLIARKDRNLAKKALQRTNTFQTTLILFVLYVGLILMSIGVNGFTYYAVHGHPYTLMSMWVYMANVFFFLFVSSLIYDQRVKTFLVKACCIIASLYALYGMLEFNLRPYSGALRVTFYNSNHYGYYLAVSIGLTSAMIVRMMEPEKTESGEAAPKPRLEIVAWCVMLFIQCFALGYNNTLGAWTAVLFTHIFLFVVYRIKDGRFNFRVLLPFAVFIGASVINGFFSENILVSIFRTINDLSKIANNLEEADEAGSGRWLIWKLTMNHIIDRPVFGNGIEGLLEIITREGSNTGSPHNEYLEYTAFFGVPAGISYVAAILSVFIHGLKHKKELNAITLVCLAGGFSYLVSAFFGVCFYYTVTYPFIFLGLSLNFTEKDAPSPLPAPSAPSGEEPSREEPSAIDADSPA